MIIILHRCKVHTRQALGWQTATPRELLPQAQFAAEFTVGREKVIHLVFVRYPELERQNILSSFVHQRCYAKFLGVSPQLINTVSQLAGRLSSRSIIQQLVVYNLV